MPETAAPFSEEEARAANLLYFTKFCPVMKQCDPVRFAFFHGTLEDCIGHARDPLAEVIAYYGYGSTRTPADVRACTAALDLSSCNQYFGWFYEGAAWRDYPAACRPLGFGLLPEGSACGQGAQCVSGLCGGGQTGSGPANPDVGPQLPIPGYVPYQCGRCVAPQPLGARCKGTDCAEGSVCYGGRCAKPRDLGDLCDGVTTFCHPWLACDAGRCALPPSECDPLIGCPDAPAWYFCSAQRRCEAAQLVGLGERCSINGDARPFRPCVHGLMCALVSPSGDGGTAEPMCVPKLEDGELCDDWASVFPCKHGSCVAGKCARIEAAQCSRPLVPR